MAKGYEGYSISDVHAELLLSILQTQQEVLAELKKLSKPVEAVTATQDSPESVIEELPVPVIEQVEKPVTEVAETVKPVKKPVQKKPATKRKTAKKKTQPKKATK